jgi:hypothetical protein
MRLCAVIVFSCLLASCDTETAPTAQQQQPAAPDGPEKFITADFIELDKIERISKFRSGIGHDYRDGAESCRSMKHYYQPKMSADWGSVKIFSPVSGTLVRRDEEWAGTQVWIRPFTRPAYTIIIFHIALQRPLAVNDSVTAGEQLGTHIGSQTMSDIAVGYSPGNSWRLISWFDIMNDSLFARYQSRGVSSRSDLIITKTARDADPLNCSGESFGTSGTLPNWFQLN